MWLNVQWFTMHYRVISSKSFHMEVFLCKTEYGKSQTLRNWWNQWKTKFASTCSFQNWFISCYFKSKMLHSYWSKNSNFFSLPCQMTHFVKTFHSLDKSMTSEYSQRSFMDLSSRLTSYLTIVLLMLIRISATQPALFFWQNYFCWFNCLPILWTDFIHMIKL